MSKVRAEQYTNRLGTGAPEIPYGVTVPEGASIDGAGGLNLTGIATAGSFKGNLTGDVSGNVTGLAATFTGPVTIGGTLTYEDVTNIDSVGVITARDGISITSGNIVGNNSTNISGVSSVTATNFYGNGASLSGIEAAPTIQLVADGTIAANTSVRVTPGGKAATISEFASALGSEEQTSGDVNQDGYTRSSYGYDKVSSRVVAVYEKQTTNKSAYKVGTRSGNSITWGSESSFTGITGNGNYSNSVKIGTDKFFVVFQDGNDIKAVIMTTTSSNTASLGTIVTLKSGVGELHDTPGVHLNPNTGNVILAYACGGGAGGIFGQMCTISGTTITVGAAVQIGTTGYSYSMGSDSVWDSIRQNVFFVYCGPHTNDKIYGNTIREPSSGTTVLIGLRQQEVNDTQNVTTHTVALAFDPIKDSFVCMWRNAGNNYGYYNYTDSSYDTTNHRPSFKNNGTTELWLGNNHVNSQNCLFLDAHYDSSTFKLIIINQASASLDAKYCTATFNSNATLTFNSDFTEWQASDYRYPTRNILLDNGAILLPYIDGASGSTTQQTRIKQFSSTNLSTGNFIGFSKEAYTNGQTATINVVGNVTTKSGLTPGEQYYVQHDGSVGTTAATPSVEAGKALTATSLLIKG